MATIKKLVRIGDYQLCIVSEVIRFRSVETIVCFKDTCGIFEQYVFIGNAAVFADPSVKPMIYFASAFLSSAKGSAELTKLGGRKYTI